MSDLQFVFRTFVSIFIIVDPLGLIPSFVGLTASYSSKRIQQTVIEATLTLFVILTVFTLWGSQILEVFGISLPAFRIAGGTILFMVAWQMLQAKRTRLKSTPEEEAYTQIQEDIGIVPLGIPMLAGPGAITNVMVLAGGGGRGEKVVIVSAILVTAILTFFALRYARKLANWLGQTGLLVLTRLMGLILAGIAIQFIIDGIKAGLFLKICG